MRRGSDQAGLAARCSHGMAAGVAGHTRGGARLGWLFWPFMARGPTLPTAVLAKLYCTITAAVLGGTWTLWQP